MANILLLEDHADTAAAVVRYLRRTGHAARVAGTVADALAAADAGPVDVLIADLELPDGSGLDVMRALAPRGVCGVACTAHVYPSDEAAARAAGFAAFVRKPCVGTALLDALRAACPVAFG